MQFKQTVNPLNGEAHVAKKMFWNIHKYPATVHINPRKTTWTRQQSPPPQPPHPPLGQGRKSTDLLLTESRGTLGFAWMAPPYYYLFYSLRLSQPGPRPLPVHRPPPLHPSPPGGLSQFLSRLHLLLGDLLLGHDGHPRGYWAGDGLLGDVVVVDEGEEATAAPGALGGVAAVHSDRHAATLLLSRENSSGVTTGVREDAPEGNAQHVEMGLQFFFCR